MDFWSMLADRRRLRCYVGSTNSPRELPADCLARSRVTIAPHSPSGIVSNAGAKGECNSLGDSVQSEPHPPLGS
jgi:hypothetical protein